MTPSPPPTGAALYQDARVTVTAEQLIVDARVHAVREITGAQIVTVPPSYALPKVLLLMAAVAAVAAAFHALETGASMVAAIPAGALFVVLAAAAYVKEGPSHALRLAKGDATVDALELDDVARLEAIAAALRRAGFAARG